MSLQKVIKEAEEEVKYGGKELNELLKDFEKDKDLVKLVVRLCKWLDADSKALWEKIEEMDSIIDERIEHRLRRHRHLPDGTPVEAI